MTKRRLSVLKLKWKKFEVRSLSDYIRKMVLDGYYVKLALKDVKEMFSLFIRCSNNLNQYVKRTDETCSIYKEDIQKLQIHLEEI